MDRTEAARVMGEAKTEKKAEASRQNGRAGGRPKGTGVERAPKGWRIKENGDGWIIIPANRDPSLPWTYIRGTRAEAVEAARQIASESAQIAGDKK